MYLTNRKSWISQVRLDCANRDGFGWFVFGKNSRIGVHICDRGYRVCKELLSICLLGTIAWGDVCSTDYSFAEVKRGVALVIVSYWRHGAACGAVVSAIAWPLFTREDLCFVLRLTGESRTANRRLTSDESRSDGTIAAN